MPPSAQQIESPSSTAPKRREVVSFHEAGHGVSRHLLLGRISGLRIDTNGGGVCWVGETPELDSGAAIEKQWQDEFADNETLLFELGALPFAIVAQHIAVWRARAIVLLAGQESERLAFGLALSSENSDQLGAKLFCRRCSAGRAGANALYQHCQL